MHPKDRAHRETFRNDNQPGIYKEPLEHSISEFPRIDANNGIAAQRLKLFQPGHAVARFREPDKHVWIVARNDETRIRRNLLHAILRRQV